MTNPKAFSLDKFCLMEPNTSDAKDHSRKTMASDRDKRNTSQVYTSPGKLSV